jgi:hypothetical protein
VLITEFEEVTLNQARKQRVEMSPAETPLVWILDKI